MTTTQQLRSKLQGWTGLGLQHLQTVALERGERARTEGSLTALLDLAEAIDAELDMRATEVEEV